jgi:tetratricopeptide (TPR) repeat protein
MAYFDLGQPIGGMPYREAMLAARSEALKAIELDASLPDAYLTLGFVSFVYEWDWEKADQMFRQAIELNPNSANARSSYGLYLSAMGRHEEGIAQTTRAVELNPSSLGMRVTRAEQYVIAGDYERSLAECERLIDIDPTYQRSYVVASWSYVALGNYEQAIEADRVAENLTAEEAASLRTAYTNLGKEGYWRWLLEWYEEQPIIYHIGIASAHAQLGNADAAFAFLEKAFEQRRGGLAFLRDDSNFDSIQEDPRLAELIRRMNFPDR